MPLSSAALFVSQMFFVWCLAILIAAILVRSRGTKQKSDGPTDFVIFILRLFLYCSSILICSLGGILLSLYCYLTNQSSNGNRYTGQLFYHCSSQLLGIHCHFVSPLPEKGGPFVLICNHQSSLDLLAMAFMWPKSVAVIAKESVRWIPLLGWHLWLANNIFIRRTERAKAINSLREAADRIRRDKVGVFLFPEGTRSHLDTTGMLQFKKGAFHLAVQSNVPIIPIVISNYSHIYSFRQRRFNGGDIYITALEPVPTDKYKEADDLQSLIDTCRQRMQQELVNLDKLKH